MEKKDIVSNIESCLAEQQETLSKANKQDLKELKALAKPAVRVVKLMSVMDNLLFDGEFLNEYDHGTWLNLKKNLANPADYL